MPYGNPFSRPRFVVDCGRVALNLALVVNHFRSLSRLGDPREFKLPFVVAAIEGLLLKLFR